MVKDDTENTIDSLYDRVRVYGSCPGCTHVKSLYKRGSGANDEMMCAKCFMNVLQDDYRAFQDAYSVDSAEKQQQLQKG